MIFAHVASGPIRLALACISCGLSACWYPLLKRPWQGPGSSPSIDGGLIKVASVRVAIHFLQPLNWKRPVEPATTVPLKKVDARRLLPILGSLFFAGTRGPAMFVRMVTAVGFASLTLLAEAQVCSESSESAYQSGLAAVEAGRLEDAVDAFSQASAGCDQALYWQALGDAQRSQLVRFEGGDVSLYATPALEAYGKAFATARGAQDEEAGAKAARSIAELGLLTGDPLKSQNWLLVAKSLEPDHPAMPALQARLDAARGELSADEIDTGLSQTRGIGRVKNLLSGSVTSRAFWDPEEEGVEGGGRFPTATSDDAAAGPAADSGGRVSIDVPMRFYSNSTELTAETAQNVENLAKVLGEQPASTQVILTGHADVRGDEQYNLELSRSRAEAIRERLLLASPALEGRITALGDGESRPIDDGDSERSHANNRRIEVTLVTAAGESSP